MEDALEIPRFYMNVSWAKFLQMSVWFITVSLCTFGLAARDLHAGLLTPGVALSIITVTIGLLWIVPTLLYLLPQVWKPSYIELHQTEVSFWNAIGGKKSLAYNKIIELEATSPDSIRIWYRVNKSSKDGKAKATVQYHVISRLRLGTAFDAISKILVQKTGKLPRVTRIALP